MFFLGKSRRFLTCGIIMLVILGSVVGICLKGTSPLLTQWTNIVSHPLCNNTGSSTLRIFNPNVICRQISLPNENHPNNGSPTPGSISNLPPTDTQSGQNTPQNSQTQTSSDNTTTQAAQAVLNQINAARAQAGLPTLQMSTQLINSAHNHNLVMQSANQLSHQLPNEPDLGTRISQVGINWSSVGENIGYSTDYLDPIDVAPGLDQDMLNEQPPDDGHRQNILSKDFTTIGIDVFIDTTNYKVWLTEDFAHPV